MATYRDIFEHTDLAATVLYHAPTRVIMCSVNKYFAKYCVELSMKLSPAPHLYVGEHALTLSDRDAILADYHLYMRLKPKYKISAYAACVVGCTEVAIDVMLRQRIFTEGQINESITPKFLGASLRGGNIKLAKYFAPLVQNPNWRVFVDIAKGGHIKSAEYVLTNITWMGLATMFTTACEYGKLPLLRYLHEKILAFNVNTSTNTSASTPTRFFCCGAATCGVAISDTATSNHNVGAMGVGEDVRADNADDNYARIIPTRYNDVLNAEEGIFGDIPLRPMSAGDEVFSADILPTQDAVEIRDTYVPISRVNMSPEGLKYARLLELYESGSVVTCKCGTIETLRELMRYIMELDAINGHKYASTCGISPRVFNNCLQMIYLRDDVGFFLQVKELMEGIIGYVHIADGFVNACFYSGINIINYIISQGLNNMSEEAKSKYKDTLAIGAYPADTSLIVYCITWVAQRWDFDTLKKFIESHKHELTPEDLNICLEHICGSQNYKIMEYIISLGAYNCSGCDKLISDHLPFCFVGSRVATATLVHSS